MKLFSKDFASGPKKSKMRNSTVWTMRDTDWS